MPDMTKAFMVGPPHGWRPQIGERVLTCMRDSPSTLLIETGTVQGIFSTPHPCGEIVGYELKMASGETWYTGINGIRPAKRRPK